MKPKLIALEGIDYSGKSTLAPALAQELLHRNIDAIYTAEPSMGPFGEEIRKVLQGKAEGPGTERAFQAWFVRDRLWHINNLLCPARASGNWLVLDRYWLSTLAYGILCSTLEDFLELHREIGSRSWISRRSRGNSKCRGHRKILGSRHGREDSGIKSEIRQTNGRCFSLYRLAPRPFARS